MRLRSTTLILLAVALLTAGKIIRMIEDDDSPFLTDARGAQWIQSDDPFVLGARGRETAETYFRARFTAPAGVPAPSLTVRAMRDAAVFVDARPVLPFARTFSNWKRGRTIALKGLAPGEHTLVVFVVNGNGPALLLARSEGLGVATGLGWEAARAGADWAPAALADSSRAPDISARFGSPAAPLRRLAIPLSALLIVAFLAVYVDWGPGFRAPSPSQWRWLLLGAWTLLALNNAWKLSPRVGADAEGHLEYIVYMASHWRVPYVYEGWEMQQAPLYYFISALFLALLRWVGLAASATGWLRLIPLACGAAQVETCYRAGRLVFPDSPRAQITLMILGGLLPMNLYIAQGIGNDPAFALLSAFVLIAGMRFARETAPPARELWGAGVLLGLALLTKAIAVLLVPILAVPLLTGARDVRDAAERAVRVFGTAFLISAWYYLRNYLELGVFFAGNWDPASHMIVWQSPGYWTWGELTRFGRALTAPIYAATSSYWDALYSTIWLDGTLSARYDAPPPWRYDFLLAGAWLALAPTAAALWGAGIAARARGALAFCLQALAIYFAGWLLLFYLEVPVFGNARYLLGALPCFAVVGAAGFERMSRTRVGASLVAGFLACWAICAYAAYWV